MACGGGACACWRGGESRVRPEVVEAISGELREAVFRFRYDIYVREMHRPQKDADHARGRIEDPLDANAHLFAARDPLSGRIAGTVRGNIVADAALGLYEDLYGLAALSQAERRATSMTTRLMIERTRRGSVLALQLATTLFARGVALNVEADYIDCNDHLIPFFEHLGYRRLRAIQHPDYGRVTLMRLDVGDIAHLRRVGSPLAAVLERGERVA